MKTFKIKYVLIHFIILSQFHCHVFKLTWCIHTSTCLVVFLTLVKLACPLDTSSYMFSTIFPSECSHIPFLSARVYVPPGMPGIPLPSLSVCPVLNWLPAAFKHIARAKLHLQSQGRKNFVLRGVLCLIISATRKERFFYGALLCLPFQQTFKFHWSFYNTINPRLKMHVFIYQSNSSN